MARRLVRLLALVLALMALGPLAAEAAPAPFTEAAFAAAQHADRHILVYVAASWCPTCSLQQAALAETLTQIERDGTIPDLAVLIVDFDTQKDVVARLRVAVQSTFLAFHGTVETGRAVGLTDAAAIKTFLLQSAASETAVRAAATRWLSVTSYALAVLAGILANLSPCVLPLLPIVLASAAAAHRLGVVALAAGVALAYGGMGLAVASLGFGIGLSGDVFRYAGALLMALLGLVLLSAQLEEGLALAGTRIEDAAGQLVNRIPPSTARGQFAIGVLLGAVWTPCAGPTLAAAITLAAQRRQLAEVALMMALFGLGAALPLLLVGTLSQQLVRRWERRIGTAGRVGKVALGVLLVAVGAAILLGLDRQLETVLLRIWPVWLTRISVSF